jgi:hypothetical protein
MPVPPFSGRARAPIPPPFGAPVDLHTAFAIDELVLSRDDLDLEQMSMALDTFNSDILTPSVQGVDALGADLPSKTHEPRSEQERAHSFVRVCTVVDALRARGDKRTAKELLPHLTDIGIVTSLSQVKRALAVYGKTHRELEAMKASQSSVEVQTELGPRVMRVPSSAKQVYASTERMLWLEADRVAHEAILAKGNRLVRIDSLPADAVIAPCVTQRKVKLKQDTGELDKLKSRHCVDGARLAHLSAKRGHPPAIVGTVNMVDDITAKVMLSDIPVRRRRAMKMDVGDAYTLGRRARSVGWMRMAPTMAEYDDDGTEMVYELSSPMWGERQAGQEWDDMLHATLIGMGWRRCEGVPAMYYFDSPTSDARLVKIVDDLFGTESNWDMPILTATLAALRNKFEKVTSELDPTSFAGLKLEYHYDFSGDGSWLKLSQPQKIHDAVQEYMPELITGAAHGYTLLTGTQLDQALERLTPASTPPPSPLTPLEHLNVNSRA